MIINPWKFKKVKTMLFDRIAELNAEVKELRNDLRNTEACVEAERNLNEARLRHNQVRTNIILNSNRADDFSVADLSML
jgi:hypothetical protein